MRTRSDGFDNLREGDMPRLRQQVGMLSAIFASSTQAPISGGR